MMLALFALLALLALLSLATASPSQYPYTGPEIPVGDWVDSTVAGNAKGFPRLVEPPAVQPATNHPTNNINVISLSYLARGINIHFQTPFGLGVAPSVRWGSSPDALNKISHGSTHTYDRTPPCSAVAVTQCSQFFHEVPLPDLAPGTTYYYRIDAANGTTASDVLSFASALAAGDPSPFSVAVIGDMGYTNAAGTYRQLLHAVQHDRIAFAWHGGDLSYADDWYSGILPCEDDWPVCYNGSSTRLPGPAPVPDEYRDAPLPAGELPNQGGPHGGDMAVLYESNWDLWQQWTNNVTTHVPYMVLPGNHEASCAEFDGAKKVLAAYLNDGKKNGTSESALTYYSCPPSQRNFTAFQHRFRMPGPETGGVGNFWYSFDYGLVHFVALDGETDYADSPEWPFARDVHGSESHPKPNETFVTDSGPFGAIDGSVDDNDAYEQHRWLARDLAAVDRAKTPWVVVMSHRPMYSSETAKYQDAVRAAFEPLLLRHGVDAYLAGHVHWYERMYPLGNGTVDAGAVVSPTVYHTNPGTSMTHIISGMAGNIESHSTLPKDKILNLTAVLDQENYGFTRLDVNATALTFTFVRGDGQIGDELALVRT